MCLICAPIDTEISDTASREELKIMEIDIWRGEFMSNEADNKTPREFFRITSGLLVRYTRGGSCMTWQKCPSGRGENARGSPWYIAGLEKWFRRRGNRETPKCSLRFGWRRIAFPRIGRHAYAYVHTDASSCALIARCIWIARIILAFPTISYAGREEGSFSWSPVVNWLGIVNEIE